jgi:hypothetical protein
MTASSSPRCWVALCAIQSDTEVYGRVVLIARATVASHRPVLLQAQDGHTEALLLLLEVVEVSGDGTDQFLQAIQAFAELVARCGGLLP